MAISIPCPDYEAMGLKKDGVYQQLNVNQLQIENEYYSSVRPKAILQGMEKPVRALQRAGVEYVELRSVDVNPFEPTGVDEQQLVFLEAFMIFNLLKDSPVISEEEQEENETNASRVAHRGREPGLCLQRGGKCVPLRDWGMEILLEMDMLCELLDEVHGSSRYKDALETQVARMQDPDLTPSAQVLREMEERKEGFFHFAFRQAHNHLAYFKSLPRDERRFDALEKESIESLEKQWARKSDDTVSFEQFLADYLAQ